MSLEWWRGAAIALFIVSVALGVFLFFSSVQLDRSQESHLRLMNEAFLATENYHLAAGKVTEQEGVYVPLLFFLDDRPWTQLNAVRVMNIFSEERTFSIEVDGVEVDPVDDLVLAPGERSLFRLVLHSPFSERERLYPDAERVPVLIEVFVDGELLSSQESFAT